jgi:hypothetical protein
MRPAQGGEGVVIVSRSGQAARAMFEAVAEKMRAGRSTFYSGAKEKARW